MSGLRIEGDVETDLSGEALAALLRAVAAHPHEFVPAELAAFDALADTIVEGHRPALSGLRGTVRATPREMGAAIGPLTVAHLYAHLLDTLREALSRPGAVVEAQVSLVVEVLEDTEAVEISTEGEALAVPRAADADTGKPVASVMIPGLGAVDLIAPAVPARGWWWFVEGAWKEAARVPERFLDGMHTVLSDHWQGPIAFVWRPEGEFPAQHLTRTYPTDDGGEECDER